MKRRLRIAGWALGLSLAMAGIGAAVGASQGAPVEAEAAPVAGSTKYEQITSAAGLEANAHYIITNGTSGTISVMSTESNGNNRRKVDATVDANGELTFASTFMDLTLGGTSGAWTFYCENYLGTIGYLNATNTTGSNYLKVVSKLDDYAYFSVSFDDGAASITCTGKSSRNVMMFNSNLFACYNSGSPYSAVYLYKEIPAETGVATGVTITTTDPHYSGEQITLTGTVSYQDKADDNRVTWSVTDGDAKVSSAGVVTVGSEQSEVKATAIDKDAGGDDVFATYIINPVANPITNISFDTTAAKKTYYVGQSLNISGVTASATYTSTNVKDYPLNKANFSGFDSSAATPSQIITVSAEENEHVFSTTYEIEIIECPALKFGTGLVDSLNTDATQQVNDKYGEQWDVALTYADSEKKYISYDAEYVHIGSGNNPVSSVSFSLDLGKAKTIKYLSVKFSAYSKDTGTVAISVGGDEQATGSVAATEIVTVSIPEAIRGQTIVVAATELAKINIYEIDYLAMTDAECVADFIDNYMYMDDYTENLGYCKDVSHHYYADAKAAFNALFPEQRALFASEDTYADARARLQNWAAANGDVFDVNNTLVKAYQGTFGGLTNNDPTAIAVAGLIGGMLLATGVGVLVIRRKKQK